MPSYALVKGAGLPTFRHSSGSKPPITPEERKAKEDDAKDRKAKIDQDLTAWFTETRTKADELAIRHNKKARYFLDAFFQGGARMLHQREKPNPYNAFLHQKALELEQLDGSE